MFTLKRINTHLCHDIRSNNHNTLSSCLLRIHLELTRKSFFSKLYQSNQKPCCCTWNKIPSYVLYQTEFSLLNLLNLHLYFLSVNFFKTIDFEHPESRRERIILPLPLLSITIMHMSEKCFFVSSFLSVLNFLNSKLVPDWSLMNLGRRLLGGAYVALGKIHLSCLEAHLACFL